MTFFRHTEPFVKQKGPSDVKRLFMEPFRQKKGYSLASWNTFSFKREKCIYNFSSYTIYVSSAYNLNRILLYSQKYYN